MVDPMTMAPQYSSFNLAEVREDGTREDNILAKGSVNRRDIWVSKEEAYKVFKSRGAWKVWDDRVLKSFVVCPPFSSSCVYSFVMVDYYRNTV
jgi:hypothetical protein